MMKILLPVDGSALALDAVRHALRLVQEGLGAHFVLVNVQEPATLYEMMTAHDVEVLQRVSEEAGVHALQEAQALLRAAGVEFDSEVGQGEVAHLLLEIAENHGCGAIVMGARGVGGLGNGGLGSVAQTVLEDSLLPVTIVQHPEEEERAAQEPGDDDGTGRP